MDPQEALEFGLIDEVVTERPTDGEASDNKQNQDWFINTKQVMTIAFKLLTPKQGTAQELTQI